MFLPRCLAFFSSTRGLPAAVPRALSQRRRASSCQAAAAPSLETPSTSPTLAASWEDLELRSASLPANGARKPAPPGTLANTRIKKAEYVKSSVELGQCPPARFPEFALVGRSNVGKSTLINSLTNNAKLALVSKTPGKTQCINHFLINNSWYLVDLPGYGFAKSSQMKRKEWSSFTQQYLVERDTLATVFLLVDCTVPPQRADLEVVSWLANSQVPFALLFTKKDKRKKKVPKPAENIQAFQAEVLKDWDTLPPTFETSSLTGEGRLDLLHFIAQLCQAQETGLLPSPGEAGEEESVSKREEGREEEEEAEGQTALA